MEKPLELIDKVANGYSIAAIIYFVYLIVLRNAKLDEELHRRDEEVGKQLGLYNSTVDDMEEKLKHLMDMQIMWTERTINDHRRDFVKFLNYVKDTSAFGQEFFGASSPELVDSFRNFVSTWLTVYRECSRKPIKKPRTPVNEYQLKQCTSVGEIADLVAQRVGAQRVEFLQVGHGQKWAQRAGEGSWSSGFSQKQRWRRSDASPEDGMDRVSWINCFGMNQNFIMIDEPDEDGWPFTLGTGCCGLTFLTPMHLFIVFYFLFGFALLGFEIAHRRIASILLITGQLALIVILSRFEQIDDLARLEVEFGKLEDANADIEKHHVELLEFYEELGDFADLWYHRTIPRLRLLKEVSLKLEDECQGSADLAMQLCDACDAGIALIDQCSGPLQFWIKLDCGRGLKVLKRGIETCADFVEQHDVQTILNQPDIWDVVRVVRVRVVACRHLSRWMPISKIDPYVRARIGDAHWVRTRTIANKQNPRWGEKDDERDAEDKDLQFRPRSMSEKLEVQVMHDIPGVCELSTVFSDTIVCMAAIDLSGLPSGKWINVQERLVTAAGHRAGHGQRFSMLRDVKEEDQSHIELSVFVCRTLEEINMLPGFREKRSSVCTNGLAE